MTTTNTYILVAILETFAPLIPLTIYWKTRKLQEPHMRFLAATLIVSFLSDLAGMSSALTIKSAVLTHTAMNLYLLASTVAICLFYKALFTKRFSNWFLVTMVILLLLQCYYFYASEITTLDRNVPPNIVYTVFSLLFFYKLIRELPTVHIQRLPIFWINAGFLIYYSGTLVLWIFADYLIKYGNNNFVSFWMFHNFLAIVKCLLFAIGLWQVTRRTQSL